MLDSVALESQSDELQAGSSGPSLGFTEKTITRAFIMCAQISNPSQSAFENWL
jgi:hypothetical protein